MWPNKEKELEKIMNDKHRLRAAFIKAYTDIDYKGLITITPKFQEEFDTRKYALFMEKEILFDRIYNRVNILLKTPKAYSEVIEICKECINRGYRDIKNMTIFKIIGVPEAIRFMGELPRVRKNKGELKKSVRELFRAVMVRTRHYAKEQYDWLKTQKDYFPLINTNVDDISGMIANQVNTLSLKQHLELCQSQQIP